MNTKTESLLAEHDRLESNPEAIRTWIEKLTLAEVRILAQALGARSFQREEDARQAARKARLTGK